MKHKIITFFFLITLGFFYNLFFIESSQAVGCAKHANGGIIAKDQAISLQVQTYTDGGTAVPAPFNYTDGYVDDEFSSNNNNACNEMPEFYGVLIYRIALCREDPYVDEANPVLDSCIDIINNPDNVAYTEIEPNVETDLTSLLDSELVIPIGTYPYTFVVVNNKLKIKHAQKYVEIDGTPAVMYGLDPESADGITGQYCYTLAKVTTYSGHIWDSDYRSAHGVGTIVQSGTGSSATMACTNDLAVANENKRYATEIVDHLGGEITDNVKENLTSSQDYSVGSGVNDGVDLASYMLKEGGLVLADSVDNAVRIGAIYRYTDPIVINELTSGIKFDFGTTLGSSLDGSVDEGGAGISDDVTWIHKVGVEPFNMKILTKKRRRATGSTGDWR